MRRLIGLLVSLSLLSGCTQRPNPDSVYLGHLAPRTGEDKEAGEQADRGVQLAMQDVTKEGNDIAGRRLAVLHGDTQGDREALQPQAVRLITINKAQALVGGRDVAEAERLGRAVQTYSIPLVTPSGFAPQPAGPGVFCLGMAPGEQGKALARFVAQEIKPARVAIVTDNRLVYATTLTAAFVAELRKSAKAEVEELTYQKDGEFADLAKRLAAREAGAVVVSGAGADIHNLRGEAQKAGLSAGVPWIFGGEEGSLKSSPGDAQAADGLHRATAFAFDEDLPRLKEFVKRFQETAKRPPDHHAALAYEAIRVLHEAFRQAKAVQGLKVRQELAARKSYDCLTGTLSFDAEHLARRPLFVVRLEKGEAKRVWKYEPDME